LNTDKELTGLRPLQRRGFDGKVLTPGSVVEQIGKSIG